MDGTQEVNIEFQALKIYVESLVMDAKHWSRVPSTTNDIVIKYRMPDNAILRIYSGSAVTVYLDGIYIASTDYAVDLEWFRRLLLAISDNKKRYFITNYLDAKTKST